MSVAQEPPKEKHIVAKPVRHINENKQSKRELWGMIAYYYPQYTLKQASKLSARDIMLLLRVARKIEAEKFYNLTQIAAAPHTEKGKGVKQLTQYFEKEIDK